MWRAWPSARRISGESWRRAPPNRIKVINNESETVVDVYVNLKVGARIPDVAGEVQHQVKVAVQSMTGKPVTKVNVHVAGIVLEEEAAQ